MSVTTINFVIDALNVRAFPFVSQSQISQSSPGVLKNAGHTSVSTNLTSGTGSGDGVTYQDDNSFGRRLLQVSSATGPPSGAVVWDAGAIFSRGSASVVSDTIVLPSRWCDIAVMCSQVGEIRLYFASVLPVSPDASTSHGVFTAGINFFNQVQDMPPLAVPSDLTKWTVWRRVEITDRYFLPVLFNLAAADMTSYRMSIQFYDAQR